MLREGERVWGGYLSISIAMIGTVFNLLTIIVVSIDYETQRPPLWSPMHATSLAFFAPSTVEGWHQMLLLLLCMLIHIFNDDVFVVLLNNSDPVFVAFVFVFTFVFHRSAERGPFESNQAPSWSWGALTYLYICFFNFFQYFFVILFIFYILSLYVYFILYSLAVVDCLYCGIILPCNAVRLLGCWYRYLFYFFLKKLFCF